MSYVGSLFFLPPFFDGLLSSSSPLRFDGLLGGILSGVVIGRKGGIKSVVEVEIVEMMSAVLTSV